MVDIIQSASSPCVSAGMDISRVAATLVALSSPDGPHFPSLLLLHNLSAMVVDTQNSIQQRWAMETAKMAEPRFCLWRWNIWRLGVLDSGMLLNDDTKTKNNENDVIGNIV
ncbi:hypothetical protein JDV02_001162 [Purpureocillium takamizusanense]|uniref:Uncharacterized protein n=1 Tax=Purpureocillium takamizusanense TaxID=2060973 RepID=A0A9Q8Q675_9HYPO|nr:uncharacterized protein JDV02_001162 [Purpureocillium takamizusanense]UNI14544.1 hypothetical protein JDV02_001162 [Purpureocillium takamizusanense]